MKTRMTQQQLNEFIKYDPYGHVLKDLKIEDIRSLKIHPAPHYSIGGIKVGYDGRSVSEPNVYAVGEAANNYGTGRKKGFGHLDAIVLYQFALTIDLFGIG